VCVRQIDDGEVGGGGREGEQERTDWWGANVLEEKNGRERRERGGLALHCTENLINVFPVMKLCGLVPNSYLHVSVSDLYIPRIGLRIWLPQNRQTDPGNI
jgi:hypothetical protein